MNVRRNIPRAHTLDVAAKQLAHDRANPILVQEIGKHAKAAKVAERRREQLDMDEQRRVERQRTFFTMLGDSRAVDNLKDAMLQQAYDLLWDGEAEACDALLQFIPEKDALAVLNAWSSDQEGTEPKSKWH